MAMTKEEQEIYDQMVKKPDDYVPPDPEGDRVCGLCGAMFSNVPATKDSPAVSSLQQFSDHQAEHNPSPAQWTDAYHRLKPHM